MAKVLKWIKNAVGTAKNIGSAVINAVKEYRDSKASQEPVTTTPTAPITYEEYINQSRQAATTQKQASYADAESYRQKAISDAYSAYALNKADYGNTANALSQMGLSGSGYSDYINSQAYAQQRGEVQTARTNEMAMRQGADATYADYMNQLNQSQMQKAEADEAERKTMYYQLWQGAQQGAYSAEAIEAIGNRMGLKYADIEALKGVIKKPTASGERNEAGETGGVEFELTDDESGESISNITIANAADVDKFIADGTIDSKQALDAVNEAVTLTTEEYNAKLKAIQDKNYTQATTDAQNLELTKFLTEYGDLSKINKTQLSSLLKNVFAENSKDIKSETDKNIALQTINQNKQYLAENDYNELTAQINGIKIETSLPPVGAAGATAGLLQKAKQDIQENVKKQKADLKTYNSTNGMSYSVTDKNTEYGVNSASLTLGEKVTITYADGSTDDAYLSLYAAKSTRKEMDNAGVRIGQIYKAKNGNYYLRGKTQYFKLKNVDTGKFG